MHRFLYRRPDGIDRQKDSSIVTAADVKKELINNIIFKRYDYN